MSLYAFLGRRRPEPPVAGPKRWVRVRYQGRFVNIEEPAGWKGAISRPRMDGEYARMDAGLDPVLRAHLRLDE